MDHKRSIEYVENKANAIIGFVLHVEGSWSAYEYTQHGDGFLLGVFAQKEEAISSITDWIRKHGKEQ